MCGICFLKRGISITSHTFTFNFFQDYLSGNFVSKQQKCKLINVSLSEHVINNKLILPEIDIHSIKQAIHPRGPDSFHCKISGQNEQQERNLEQIQNLKDGEALMVQSILSMRGQKMEEKFVQLGHLLYNGEVYSTGQLQKLKMGQNDTQWLNSLLQSIPSQQLSIQKISSFLKNIRGDFAIIYQRDNKLFICKDYFGKKSLLVGFEENGIIVTSVGIGKFESKNEGGNEEEDKEEKEWLSKYKSEWNNSRLKSYFQIPRNVVIEIQFQEKQTIWKRQYIYDINLILPFPKELSSSMEDIYKDIQRLLKESMVELVSNIRQFEEYFNNSKYIKIQSQLQNRTSSSISVLFSGGLDSTLIARLLDIILPQEAQIDLINIVFSADAPDRKTSLKAYEQLCSLNKNRKFNLILKNQTLQSIQQIQKQHIKLIYPKNTHMDFNISAVLSLASLLDGTLHGTQNHILSGSKIVLSGLGADELFSGYSRYRVAYLRGGIEEQERQMIFDLDRLWIRNLGRDDRAISNQGKQSRYPFLYSPLVDYLKEQVPLHLMADYTKPKGEGDKIILREVAARLGLVETSKYKKTAIQFGTRLAKQSNIKAFGSNRKAKGTYHYQTKQ